MSEEVLGAIKFQHQNLLHLVDHLRTKIEPMQNLLRVTRDELQKRKHEQTYVSFYRTLIKKNCRRIEELENIVEELRKKINDRDIMPPPALPDRGSNMYRCLFTELIGVRGRGRLVLDYLLHLQIFGAI
jgi:hypothetical protein